MWITEFRENKRECFAVLAEMAISSGFSYQHVGGTEIVLAGHALLQLLRHLLDILNFIQQVQDMLMFNSFNPQFAKLIPFAVQQHLARKQIFFDLELKDWVSPKSYQSKPISVMFFFVTISTNSSLTHSLTPLDRSAWKFLILFLTLNHLGTSPPLSVCIFSPVKWENYSQPTFECTWKKKLLRI